ncbi:LacI family DNA-binding transcriptional regulator [Zhouia sp. PK063]|uniref:LacI family DNA-binding transcriptional regulator n=1 Tax=Zhouia sp. PK063 TaxID=3373602 RepID=UPI0037B99395
MKRKITLKEIAKELDVSISTVSKALKDHPEIGKETKEKVLALTKLYNYIPNNIALSLKNSKARTIGLIIPEIVHHFFSSVIGGIENIANRNGYNVIICVSNESLKKEVINMDMLAGGTADGFIISASKETLQKKDYHHIQAAIDRGLPVVMFDRVIEEIVCDKILIDDKHAAKDAVNYLLEKGCKNIGVASTADYLNVGKLRTDGYIQALSEHHLTVDPDHIIKIDDINDCDDLIAELIAKGIDGLLAVNEIFAAKAIKVAQAQNIKIPEELAIIAFTDGMLSRYCTPSISTINQHGTLMGEKAAELLIQKLENDNEEEEYFETVFIETDIIERSSTLL